VCAKRLRDALAERHLLRPLADKTVRMIGLIRQLTDAPGMKLDADAAKIPAAEWIEYATDSCTSEFLATSVRFFDEGFARDPSLAHKSYRTTAKVYGGIPTNGFVRAVAALGAGVGIGNGLAKITEKDRAAYRQMALAGLKSDLARSEEQRLN